MQRALQRNKIQRDETSGIKTLEVWSTAEEAKVGTKPEMEIKDDVKMDKKVMSAAGGIKLSLPIPASPLECTATHTEIVSLSSVPSDNGLDGEKCSDKDNGSDKGDVVCSSGRTSLEGVSDDDGGVITGESVAEISTHPMTA